MTRFDAELYLRIAGEETILGVRPRPQRPWASPLLEPASALVAVGAISAARARAVVDEYALADALRADDGAHVHRQLAFAPSHRARRPKREPFKPRRVVPCDRTIEDANGSLVIRRVTLSEYSTSLAITWRPTAPTQGGPSVARGSMVMFGPGGRRGRGGAGGPPHPQLTDDRGASTGTGFSGGGSDQQWDGHLRAHLPLSPDTAWIEVDGERIELSAEAPPCEVWVESLADEPAALRYLWRRLADSSRFHDEPDVDASIDALIACGALDPEDPVLSDIRAVRDALPRHPMMSAGAPRGVRELPEPWRSLLGRQGRQDGPEGAIALSAVTPDFEGFSVAVSALESRPDGFAIEAEVAPGIEAGGPFRTSSLTRELIWWAADDRGNHHLGQLGGWNGGGDYASAEIEFWPALHPKARRLQIMPTAEATRAVIRVPLAWDRDHAAAPRA